jgi:hypothetical protein
LNIRLVDETVASAVSLLTMGMVTGAEGARLSRMVKDAFVPFSLTFRGPPVTVIPAASLSVFVTETLRVGSPL